MLRLKQIGDFMRKYSAVVMLLAVIIASSVAHAAPPIFKEKKYYGPMPYNSFSFSAVFLDGADFSYLTEHLNNWAVAHNGSETFEELGLAPYARLSYERLITPKHFLKLSSSFNYLKTTSVGSYVAEYPDTNYYLNSERSFKVYLLAVEAGFAYYYTAPEARSISPYLGAGFSAVFPMARLDTESTLVENGEPFSNPNENASQNSFQAGLHMEMGIAYFITDRYAAAIEGKYQMAQSKFDIHGGNFDLDYTGFILSLNLMYYL